jgi:uncharacterized surface protein with fasciclin (FAS1) repeats
MNFLTLLSVIASANAQTALDIVLKSQDHTTLASLAGTVPEVVELLKSNGPLTLFAPTDAAFNKLDKATLDAVSTDKQLLADVLKYHAIGGTAFNPSDAPKKSFPTTVFGKKLGVTVADSVTISFGLGSSTVSSSKTASNGIVHVVDTVLIPPPSASATAEKAGLSELVKALSDANLVAAVDGVENATIFAPTNAAFAKLNQFAADNKLELTPELLTNVLKLHVVPSVVFSTDVLASSEPISAKGLSSEPIEVKEVDGKVVVKGQGNETPATVETADIIYDNGVIHVIDEVLLPDLNPGSKSNVMQNSEMTRFSTYAIGTVALSLVAVF